MRDLEPIISQSQLDFHYNKHYKAYVDGMNHYTTEMEDARRNGEFKKYLDLTSKYRFNASGRYNHEFFFESLLPIAKGGGSPTPNSKLRTMIVIEETWGSV